MIEPCQAWWKKIGKMVLLALRRPMGVRGGLCIRAPRFNLHIYSIRIGIRPGALIREGGARQSEGSILS